MQIAVALILVCTTVRLGAGGIEWPTVLAAHLVRLTCKGSELDTVGGSVVVYRVCA